MRNRKVMKYAGMMVIKLLPADVKDFDLEVGDEIDIDELPSLILRRTRRRKKRK